MSSRADAIRLIHGALLRVTDDFWARDALLSLSVHGSEIDEALGTRGTAWPAPTLPEPVSGWTEADRQRALEQPEDLDE